MTHLPAYEWQGETLKPVQKPQDEQPKKDSDSDAESIANELAEC